MFVLQGHGPGFQTLMNFLKSVIPKTPCAGFWTRPCGYKTTIIDRVSRSIFSPAMLFSILLMSLDLFCKQYQFHRAVSLSLHDKSKQQKKKKIFSNIIWETNNTHCKVSNVLTSTRDNFGYSWEKNWLRPTNLTDALWLCELANMYMIYTGKSHARSNYFIR